MKNQLIKILTKKTIKNEVKHMIKSQKNIKIRITKFELETDKNIIFFFRRIRYIIYIYRKNNNFWKFKKWNRVTKNNKI